MELRQLRYFRAVVEAGSLSAAALKLHLSQPPLSVAISKLEAELGVELLTRTSRGVEPTAAGAYLLDASSRVLGEVDEIMSTVTRFRTGFEGAVTMAAVPVLMWHRMPRLLRQHARSHPGVEIRLTNPPPWTALEMLRNHKVDLAAVMVAHQRAFIARHREAFDAIDWGELPLVAVLPPEFADAPDPLPAAEFRDSTMMMPGRMAAIPSVYEAVEQFLHDQGIGSVAYRHVETIQGGMPLIESGVARAILPDPDRRSLERFNVVVRTLDPAPESLRALVMTRRGEPHGPALEAVLEQITRMHVGG